MGITARGAWECVKHHFRNLGIDVQKEPFTVAGIGDMSGDVFGNGVLLLAGDQARGRLQPPAHLHRPRPRPRDELPRARAPLRPAALDLAGLRPRAHQQGRRHLRPLGQGDPALARRRGSSSTSRASEPSGEEVMRKILTARVDLLYNGGIGTYVKAESEEDAEVGDRTNDRVRVDGTRGAGPGDRRGRQPRPHPEGPARVLGGRGPAQHRRRRQLRRGRHLGPRGEHQDPPGHAGEEGRREGPRGEEPDPRGDDATRWRPSCSPTTRARRSP